MGLLLRVGVWHVGWGLGLQTMDMWGLGSRHRCVYDTWGCYLEAAMLCYGCLCWCDV